MMFTETIAAVATACGNAAISVIRISGPQSLHILQALEDPLSRQTTVRSRPDRCAVLLHLHHRHGELIDEALVTVFHAPKSYTGETVVEIAAHGGLLITQRLLEAIVAAGARLAQPGEFTQRAFLHGKLDLTQAEAVMDLISAESDLAIRAAHQQRAGHLGQKTLSLRDALIEALAQIEAFIDFPEEDISPEQGEQLLARIEQPRREIESLLATADRGRQIRHGIVTVLLGEPNVGKSSLLNRLCGFERAIVSSTPGTTRDTIEQGVHIGGLLLRLVDTAGLRERTNDVIEQEGMRRSQEQANQADLLLRVFDGSQPRPAELPVPLHPSQKQIIVLNKADLGQHASWQDCPDAIAVSTLVDHGLDALARHLESGVLEAMSDGSNQLISINTRHQDCLRRAHEFLLAGESLLENQHGLIELCSIELREAIQCLGEIVGQIDHEDVLGVIFSRFCIGK